MTNRKQSRKTSDVLKKPQSGKTTPVLDRKRKESPQCAVENNGKQRRLGGVTGRGFMPGESGNPGGRPRTHGLLAALRAAVEEVRGGVTVEKALVETLITEALQGHNRLGAIQTVFDRLEGRPKQQLDLNDITAAMANRSPEALVFYAEHGCWPEDENTAEVKEQHEE